MFDVGIHRNMYIVFLLVFIGSLIVILMYNETIVVVRKF
jgi:hypothetical protein